VIIKDKKIFYYHLTYLCDLKIFMFSKTCQYAIRAMLFIAQKSEQRKRIGIKGISQGVGVPEHFLAKKYWKI